MKSLPYTILLTILSTAAFGQVDVVVKPDVVIEHREPRTTVIEERRAPDRGCSTTTVHKENEAGDSKTVKKTDCD
jgi:hypothetical protein